MPRKEREHVTKKAREREQPFLSAIARQFAKFLRLRPKAEHIERRKRKERLCRILHELQPTPFEQEQCVAKAAVRRHGERMCLPAFHTAREERLLNYLGRERTEMYVTHSR